MIGEETIKEETFSDGEEFSLPNSKLDENEQDSEGYFSMSSGQSRDSSNYDVKSPSARDFFDIDEMAEDEVSFFSEQVKYFHNIFQFQLNEDYDADDEGRTDENLMPPPPAPTNKEQKVCEMLIKLEEVEERKLETPLAAMLPSKYANVDVTELFPDFRHGKVK